ncbi:phage tail protein [Cetobacterium sp. 2A]|uniref:phage tail protein n=1 Tax=Cetobacterium sp. 2A TaxID=2754723 RepID=UPI00163CB9CC|nr:phage tail protein [Cetobacterium sp. 2A]MBC2855362.1 phage tail protein [Cetobacterium sp. 2A]
MEFRHGLRTNEIESGEKVYLSAKTPIVVFGAAPINMGDMSCVNQPTLIQNVSEATKYFGGVNKVEGFNISEVLYSAFQLFGVAPVICINVLNPKKHSEVEVLTGIIVKNGMAKIEKVGIIPSELILKKGGTEESIDVLNYQTSFDSNGYLEIYFEDLEITLIDGSVKRLNPKLVTPEDIIGQIDIKALKKEGLELVDDIFTKYSVIPGAGIAPGYTHDNELRTIMNTKFQSVNGGKWKSIIITDIPENVKYGDAIKWKKDNNAIDPEQILCYGKGVLGDKRLHLSTLVACELLRGNAENGGVPCDSPSNKQAKVSKVVYKNEDTDSYEEMGLDERQAELLNENGIVTAIQTPGGFMFWGNRTSAFQPGGTTEKKDIWIHAKRMIQFICNTIALNNQNEVDKTMSKMKASAIRDDINQWLSALKSEEKISGARVAFRQEDNPEQNVANGKFVWAVAFGDVPIGEDLLFNVKNTSEFAVEMYKN